MSSDVFLVYGRRAQDAPEPLIAVVTSEAAVHETEERMAREHAGIEVRWERHLVVGARRAPVQDGQVLYLVGSGEPSDPVYAGIYADAAEAGRVVTAERSRRGGVPLEVRELPVGWMTAARPWETE